VAVPAVLACDSPGDPVLPNEVFGPVLTHIARRLLLAIPTLLALTALLFFSITKLLGTPATMMLGEDASPAAIAELNARYGFDRPAHVQYFDWLGKAVTGDFGRSYTSQDPVGAAIAGALPVTLELACWSILLAVVAATGLNSLPNARPLLRRLVVFANLVGITTPNFILGIGLIFLFSVQLGWLPTTGWAPWSDGIGTHLRHMIMPVLTLSAYYFGAFSLVYRVEFADVYRRLYIRTARAKGLSPTKVAFKHALPNAILPVITFAGLSMGHLTGGAVVTETVFSMPGIGRLFVAAIAGRDFPVMLGVGMVVVVGVVIMNLLADILYTLVNPQIRLE
jgi:peptide/nickel transport system permease protein